MSGIFAATAGILQGGLVRYSDDFLRASLGSTDWTVINGGSQADIVGSDGFGMLTGAANVGQIEWNTSLPYDQFCQATIHTDADVNATQFQVGVRRNSAGRYVGAQYDNDTGADLWVIKYEGLETADDYIGTNSVASAPVAGDTLRLEAYAHHYRLRINRLSNGYWETLIDAYDVRRRDDGGDKVVLGGKHPDGSPTGVSSDEDRLTNFVCGAVTPNGYGYAAGTAGTDAFVTRILELDATSYLKHFYVVDDSSAYVTKVSTKVSDLLDQVGGLDPTQATDSNRPTIDSSAPNSRGRIISTGSMWLESASSITNSSSDRWIVLAGGQFTGSSPSAYQALYALSNGTNSWNMMYRTSGGSTTKYTRVNSLPGDTTDAISQGLDAQAFNLYLAATCDFGGHIHWCSEGSEHYRGVNGNAQSTVCDTGSGKVTLLANQGGANPASASLSLLMAWQVGSTGADIQQEIRAQIGEAVAFYGGLP